MATKTTTKTATTVTTTTMDADGANAERKNTPDFGRFHVTRAAIHGRTILTFRRKQEHDEKHGSVIPGRIIVADIHKADVGSGTPVVKFIVRSYMAGEKPRVLFSGDCWVCLSKVEKIVYRMVKCNIKETQRRKEVRKRKRDAMAAKMTVEDAEDARI